jgi:hypothetical protein
MQEYIKLKKAITFQEIEKNLGLVIEHPEIKLLIPNSMKTKGIFGIEGLVIQLIFTWLRNNKGQKTLRTYIDSNNQNDFEDLCSNLYGIVALRFSDTITDIDKKEIIREDALKSAYEHIRKIINKDFKGAFKGPYIAIPSIKAIGSNKEFNSPFYNGEVVIGIEGFQSIVWRSLESVVTSKSKLDFIQKNIIKSLTDIIRELFTNTDKHARRDEFDTYYDKNLRAVIFNAHYIDATRISELNKGGIEWAMFASEWIYQSDKKIAVLDITIVDSGPGYARRWKKLPKEKLTIDDEIDAIMSCFQKHNKSGYADSSGSGLSNVLGDLKKLKGFFRLRTGRTLVTKSFYQDNQNLTKGDIRKMSSFAEGVVFNIVIPIP